MERVTKPQLAAIGAMVVKLKLEPQKKDIVAGISGGRCESSKDLTKDEAKKLIEWLKSEDPDEKEANKMRRKIISMAHECGYRKPGTTKVDTVKLDEWCVKYGYLHKKLNQYSKNQLPLLVTQFQQVYKGVLNGI